MASRPLSPLLATQSGQNIPLQLLVPLFMRADVLSNVVVAHLPASTHPLSPPPFINCMEITALSLASPSQSLSRCVPPAKVSAQNVRLSPALDSAYSSNQTLSSFLTQLRGNQNSVLITQLKEKNALAKAFNKHKTETQIAQ